MSGEVRKRVIILHHLLSGMQTTEGRTMPVCFTPEQMKIVEEYARKKGMFNASQAIEELASN
jgi:hypothetical protein